MHEGACYRRRTCGMLPTLASHLSAGSVAASKPTQYSSTPRRPASAGRNSSTVQAAAQHSHVSTRHMPPAAASAAAASTSTAVDPTLLLPLLLPTPLLLWWPFCFAGRCLPCDCSSLCAPAMWHQCCPTCCRDPCRTLSSMHAAMAAASTRLMTAGRPGRLRAALCASAVQPPTCCTAACACGGRCKHIAAGTNSAA